MELLYGLGVVMYAMIIAGLLTCLMIWGLETLFGDLNK